MSVRKSRAGLSSLLAGGEAVARDLIERRWPGSRNATATEAARALGVSPRTVWRWLSGEAAIPGRVVFALMALELMEGRAPWSRAGGG